MSKYQQLPLGFSIMEKPTIFRRSEGCWVVYLFDDGSLYLYSRYLRQVNQGHHFPSNVNANALYAPKYARELVQKAQDYWRNY